MLNAKPSRDEKPIEAFSSPGPVPSHHARLVYIRVHTFVVYPMQVKLQAQTRSWAPALSLTEQKK